MKITYIYHSGFLIETDTIAIIIDFYQNNNAIKDILYNSKKKLYILSSHSHHDHFNEEIHKWKNERENIRYIFSDDIMVESFCGMDIVTRLGKGSIYKDENLYIKAFGSTDIGISFLIEIEGKTIFHAGDLNNWHWMEESTEEEWKNDEKRFLEELEDIYKEYQYLDFVFFPVDDRLGNEYMRGAEQFIDRINVCNFFPMHFNENYNTANAFYFYCQKKGVRFFDISHKGQIFIV